MKKQTILLLWAFLLTTIFLVILFIYMGIQLIKESGALTWVANKTELVLNNFDCQKNKIEVDESEISYRAQLYHAEKRVPIEFLNAFLQIGEVRPIIGMDSSTTYYSKTFETIESCDSAITFYKTFNLENVFRVIEYKDEIYTTEKFAESFTIKD